MRLVRVLAVATALLALGSISAATAAQAATLSGVVEGQRAGKEPERLPGIKVVVTKAGGEEDVATTATNELGKYALELPEGTYDVRFQPGAESQYQAITVHEVEVMSSHTLNVVLATAEFIRISGAIHDSAGEPVAGAHLVLVSSANKKSFATTAEDGSYSFAVPADSYTLNISGQGIAGLPTNWSLSTKSFALEADRTLAFALPATHQVTVEVLGNKGVPLAGARVQPPSFAGTLEQGGVGALSLGASPAQLIADEAGRASFLTFVATSDAKAGEVTPPSGSGYGSATFTVGTVEGDATVVVQPPLLPPMPVISGAIHDSAGEPVAGAHLVLVSSANKKSFATTAEDGSYSFAVPADSYTLNISGQGIAGLPTNWSLSTKSFALEADRTLAFALPATHQVTVEVLGNKGVPLAGARVQPPSFAGTLEQGGVGALSLGASPAQLIADEAGRASFLTFVATSDAKAGEVTPPSGSGYGSATFTVGTVEGDATVVVGLQSSAADGEPPQLLEFGFEPGLIDVSAAPQTVSVYAHIADELSGVKWAQVVFAAPGGKTQVSGQLERVSGGFHAGDYRIDLPFNGELESGTWTASVILEDEAGNTRQLDGGQLEELGFPSTLQVEGGEEESGEDTTAPKVDELSLEPGAIDVSAGPGEVGVKAHVTDDLSGAEEVRATFTAPNGETQTSRVLERLGGSATNGNYYAAIPFEQFSESGTWRLSLRLVDAAGNVRELGPGQLKEMGFPSEVQVFGGEEPEDSEAPQLHGIEIESSEIDTGSEKQLVSFYLQISDDLSGVKEGRVYLRSPSGKQSLLAAGSEIVYGSDTNGIVRAQVTFPRYSEDGAWQIESVRLNDRAGHEAVIDNAQLKEEGFQRFVHVEGEEDVEPPHLTVLGIEPESVDTSSSNQTVMVVAHVTDNLSGFHKGRIFFRPPSSEQLAVGSEFARVSGDANDGIYQIPVTFKEGGELGEWRISQIQLVDETGNEVTVGLEQIEEEGFPHTVTVGTQPPAVTAVEPGSGPEAGGTKVQISGSGLGGAKEVRFGSTPALEFGVQSPTSIVAVAPPGTGTVDVTVTTPAGTSEASSADRFRYAPPVTLSSSPNPSVHGQKVTFTAKVAPLAEGAPTPLGTIAFVEGSTTLKVVNLTSKGTATFSTTTLGAGKHPVVAQYSGDANFAAAESEAVTQVVSKAATQLTLASSLDPAPFGSGATLKATVAAVAPGAGTPAGTVTFSEGETVLGTIQLSGANANLSLKTLPVGKHEITAVYSGDANDEPSKAGPVTQTIVKASTETTLTSTLNPAPYGSSATLKATVDAVAPALGTPAGNVTFREGETVLATLPLGAGGSAKYALKTTPPGSYPITAEYEGTAEYEPSAAAIEQTVTQAETETTLTSTLNPAPYGSAATLKATVKAIAPGGGTPSGTVTFWEGETVLATVPLASGSAKLAIKSFDPGTHSIKATYSGDPNYAVSLAGVEQVVTKAATTLNLTSTKSPAPKGSSGTIKATVKAVAPGGGTPIGTVVFREGETVLAVVPLSSGSATYPLKSLAVGTHEITASFGGSANYEGSEDAISQVITP